MRLILLAFIITVAFESFSQNSKLLATCCEGRKCTGSSNCTACTTCSGCKHCAKNGGTCGVCSGGSSYTTKKKEYSTTTVNKKRKNSKESNTHIFIAEQELEVISSELNLRKEASVRSEIIEKLHKSDKLKFISSVGEWVYTESLKSGKKGYVKREFVR